MASVVRRTAAEEADSLQALLDALSPLHVCYAEGELLCREGTFVAGLQLITEGLVLETSGDPSVRGVSRGAELLGVGDVIGLETVLPRPVETSLSSQRTLSEVHLVFVDRGTLDEALRESASLAVALLRSLSLRHFRLRRALARGSLPPTGRLHSALLEAATVCGAASGEGPVRLPPEIDLRVMGDLARLSPAQVRRGVQELPGVAVKSGRFTFLLETLLGWRPTPEKEQPLESLLNDG